MIENTIKNSENISQETKNVLLAVVDEMSIIEELVENEYSDSDFLAVQNAFNILRTSFVNMLENPDDNPKFLGKE